MSEQNLTPQQNELYELMSDISEDCYCAGWIMGNEFSLWAMATETAPDRSYGQDVVPEESLQRLRELSAAIGGWIYWHDDEHEPDLPADDWGPRFIAMADWLRMCGDDEGAKA
jgi:hypothetical protein